MASMRSIRAIAAGARRRSRRPQGDQAHRAGAPDRSRPAVLDLEPGQAGRLLGRRGGGRGHQPRGAAHAAARAGCLLSTPEDFKDSNDPDFEAKQQRVLELYAIADGHAEPGPDDPTVVI